MAVDLAPAPPHTIACRSCGRFTREPRGGCCGVCASGGFGPHEARLLRVVPPDARKRCQSCHEELLLAEFAKEKAWRRAVCRTCRTEERRALAAAKKGAR